MPFPDDALRLAAALYLGGVWTDISSYVLVRDGVTVTRGRADESSTTAPSRATLTLKNDDGRFSPRNPTSPYYGLLGRNTPLRIAVATTDDTFTRTTANGWGTADTGQVWTTAGGAAGDYSTNAAKGLHSAATRSVNRFTVVPAAGPDVCPTVTISTAVLAATQPFRAGLVARYTSANNYYLADLEFNPAGGAIHLELWQTVGGVAVQLADVTTTGLTHSAGVEYTLALDVRQTIGDDLVIRSKVWATAVGEPDDWNVTLTDTGGGLPAVGSIGVRTRIDAANTNTLPVVFTFDAFRDLNFRFHGEVPNFQPKWDLTGADVSIPIDAAGITRRMGQGASPLRSALYRDISVKAGVISYWPMEDGDNAKQLAAGPPAGTAPMRITGRIQPGAGTQPGIGSAPVIVQDSTGYPTGAIAPSTTTTWTVLGLFYLTEEPDGLGAAMLDISSAGTVRRWWLYGDATTNELILEGIDVDGALVISDAFVTTNQMWNRWLYFFVVADQQGSDLHWSFGFYDGVAIQEIQLGSVAGTPNGAPLSVTTGYGGQGSTSVGHLFVMDDQDPFAPISPMTGWAGETADNRILFLCAEENVDFELIGTAGDSALVGVQPVASLLTILNDAADADMGMLFEPRHSFGLAYRTHRSLYNQTGLALDYAAEQLAPPLEPVEDDQRLRNDVTVKRFNGSEAQYVQQTGPLNVQEPKDDPDGVGRYDEAVTVHVYQDQQLPDIARWRVHLGTWDEARYATVTVDLAAAPALIGDASALDLGDKVTIDNPPAWLPPDLIELLVHGATERIGQFEWRITWNCTPAGPYNVAVFDDDVLGKLATDGSTLAEDLTTVETAVDVATTNPIMPLWTTDVAEFPFDIRVGGERMTVTAISGAASPQTFTVTRSVNGVVKTHATGADVQLWQPAVLAL